MSKMSVIEFAEHRLAEEERERELGADNRHDIQYWAAYLDGARAQQKEDERNPHGEMREQLVDLTIERDELLGKLRKIVHCGACRYTERVDDHEIWCTGRGWPMQLVASDGFCDKGKAKE